MKTTFFTLLAIYCAVCSFGATAQAQSVLSPNDRRPVYTPQEAPPVRIQHHRSTELGDALDAYSNVIDAQGRFVRNRSEAVTNLQYAESLRLQNLIDRERAKVEIERQRLELQSLKYERQSLSRQNASANQMRTVPVAVVTTKGTILWIEPLRHPVFASYRETLENQVFELRLASTMSDREQILDSINQTCQDFVVAIQEQTEPTLLATKDSSQRFVIRLYDDLQQPGGRVGPSVAMTSYR
ncbi:MAG TPA: hypothetical protein VL096_18335 [Pirellulaceae bacterium]|nr:hypothetical protein [Pirellulaceae bacterium]